MSKHTFSETLFTKVPVVGIVRGLPFNDIKKLMAVYLDAGLTTIEITMNTDQATDIIRYAIDNYAGKLNIGAGTVCTEEELDSALEAGAQFVVTPVINQKIIERCVQAGIPIFPGAFTPTEIYNAWALGATMVKIFPATQLGPDYIKDIKGPMSQIKLMPTGGVTLDNIDSYRKAGANGYGMGSYLFDKTMIKEGNWEGLKTHFQAFVKKAGNV